MSDSVITAAGGRNDSLAQGIITGNGLDEQSNMAGQLDADADIDTDDKPKPARKKSVSKAAGADDKAKTPRKRGPKKQSADKENTDVNKNDSAEEKGGEVIKPTPKKRGPKVKKVDVDCENGDADVEDDGDVEPATPRVTPAKKRTPKSKKESNGGEAGLSASNSAKKRASIGEAGDDEDSTPTKKSRAVGRKAEKNRYPTSRSELSDADKLMLDMKKDGKSWAEITAAVSDMTKQTYGKSTLSNRYIKVMDALTEWKDGDIERMLFVRDKVEQDIEAAVAAFKKEAESKIWASMAKAMHDLGADDYNPGAVEKAWIREKRDGFPHRATMAAVMAAYSSAGAGQGGHGSEVEAKTDEADEMGGLKLEEDMENMDTSADIGTYEA